MTPTVATIAALLVTGNLLVAETGPVTAPWEAPEELVGGLQTGEGPVWDGKGGLYFSEIFAEKIHHFDEKTGRSRTVREETGRANGLALDAKGRLVMCEGGNRRLTRREADGRIVTLWEADEGKRGGPNDVVISSSGAIYFTVPGQGCVFRIGDEGVAKVVVTGIKGANGVMLSRDEAVLYVTEYKAKRVHAFALEDAGGTVGEGSIFATIETAGEGHGADGMAVDEKNRLYVCCLGGVWIYEASGKSTGMISLPGHNVTNCAFRGDDFGTLYITAKTGLFRVRRR